MDSLQSQDGQLFIRAVAQFIRLHEKALANSLQLTVQHRRPAQNGSSPTTPTSPGPASQTSTSTLAAALSFAGLNFKSHAVKSAQLTLTPHHLFYLLDRIEELDINVGPMGVRFESIHNDSAHNYISFLQNHKQPSGRSDGDSIHSVSSIRSVMSGMNALWSSIGLSASSRSEKAKQAQESDLKYIYGAFTKLPSLRLTPDHRTPLIKGFEQFPFDTAVPLFAFKNLQQLEIVDLDFRTFHGWDRLAEQLCLLTIKRGNIDDPIDLLESIVLDDAETRRRRSNRSQGNIPSTPSWSVPSTPRGDYARSHSDSDSPQHTSPSTSPMAKPPTEHMSVPATPVRSKTMSSVPTTGSSPKRPTAGRPATSYRHVRGQPTQARRTGSGSSNSSEHALTPARSESAAAANVGQNILPASKWQRLVYLSLADNGLTQLPERSIMPLVPSLRSLNLSANLFTEIPESLARLSRLVSLDLSGCMIDTLQNLVSHPLPAITTLKLKSNRLHSLAGIEQLPSLENLHVQDNKLSDPDEAARLAQIPKLRRLWIKHNPLARSFPDYRVRIMNHFRKAPGFVEDIIIDDQPPSYTERKQLVERVTKIELEPVAPLEHKVILVQDTAKKINPELIDASNQLSVVTLQREPSSTSVRRKKGPRRRIVDLSANDALQEASTSEELFLDRKSSDRPAAIRALSQPLLGEDKSILATQMIDGRTARDGYLTDIPDDDYRQKVEDLRLKFGSNWLAAIHEQHWQSEQDSSHRHHTQTSQPPQLHHCHAPATIVHVGASMS